MRTLFTSIQALKFLLSQRLNKLLFVGTAFVFALAAPQAFALTAQLITFSAITDKAVTAAPFTAVAVGGASGNPVIITSTFPAVCTATGTNGTTITLISTGFCLLTANQAGNATFDPAVSTPRAFIVKLGQSIVFNALDPKASDDAPFFISAIATPGINPVVFTTSTPDFCSVGNANGTEVTIIRAGVCTISANIAADATYVAANTVTQSFTITLVNKVTSSITGDVNGTITPFGRTLVLVNDETEFTIVANPKYLARISGTCVGNLINGVAGIPPGAGTSTYKIFPFVESCTVVVRFDAVRPTISIAGGIGNVTPAATAPVATSSQINTPAAFTATLRGVAGLTNLVAVQFLADDVAIAGCTAQPVTFTVIDDIAAYQASCTTSALPVGPRSITASYAGNNLNFAATTLATTTPTQALTHTVIGVVVIPPDTTPDAFSFVSLNNVGLGETFVSNTVTITGINTATPVSISGGEYSIGCNNIFTTAAATAVNGQVICVRLSSSSTGGVQTSATLNVGGVTASYSVTTITIAPDTTPDVFSFAAVANAALSSTVTSAPITVSGINTPSPVSVSGALNAAYSVGCTATFITSVTSIINGQTVCVRLTSSSVNSTTSTATLTIGGVSANFNVTTVAFVPDTTPDAFSFVAQTNVALNTGVVSNAATITGINTATPVSISTGGGYSVGCTGTYSSTAGTILTGQTVCVRLVSSVNNGAAISATLTIGGVAASFTATTIDVLAVDRYRIYIPSTLGHLFTIDANEYNVLTTTSPAIYLAEGIDHKMFRTPVTKNGQTATAYYRLYLKGVRQHFWTTDANEYAVLRADTANVGDDGTEGYLFARAGVAGTVPLYRLVLGTTSIHHWTIDTNEFNVLLTRGWIAEGAPGNPVGVTGYVVAR